MLTIELFGFKASRYIAEQEIIEFFKKFDSKIDGQLIFYEIEPRNFHDETSKVVKLIASDKKLMRQLRRSGFLNLKCFGDANVGLFHYIIVKKANLKN